MVYFVNTPVVSQRLRKYPPTSKLRDKTRERAAINNRIKIKEN